MALSRRGQAPYLNPEELNLLQTGGESHSYENMGLPCLFE